MRNENESETLFCQLVRFKVAQVTHQDVPLVKHSASGLLPTHLKRPGGADLHSAHTEVEWGF